MSERWALKHVGVVKNGKYIPDNPDVFKRQFALYEGKSVDVTVTLHRKDRTEAQNKYYWAVVVNILGDYFGYSPEEMHQALKMKFLMLEDADKKVPTTMSTTYLSTAEFSEYVEKIKRWAAEEYQVDIPDAGRVSL